MNVLSASGQGESNFEKFLLSEYSNIAEAHFKKIETISTFFKHYLIIMSIPITILIIFINIAIGKELTDIISKASPFLAIILLVISGAGFGVLCYIINIRLDAVLYASAINGIRKYFYDRAQIDDTVKLHMRALPQSASLPSYHEKSYFWPVVFSFSLFDSFYFLFFCITFAISTGIIPTPEGMLFKAYFFWHDILVIIPTFLFFILHFLIYYKLAEYREIGYLKSQIIGVDIDGVLNKHREHFCKLLEKNTGKKIKPEQITTIPVHEDKSLVVTREDEKEVFNDPNYWINMPAIDDASNFLRDLRNSFKLKTFVFSHRPWPNTIGMADGDSEKIKNKWKSSLEQFERETNLGKFHWIKTLYKGYIIQITELWLGKNKFEYDKLIREKGNKDVADPRGLFRNRFYISRKKKIRFFVEDVLEKAIKLAFICDTVFLIDQPYNQSSAIEPPGNIIRVKSWEEIYKNIRKLI